MSLTICIRCNAPYLKQDNHCPHCKNTEVSHSILPLTLLLGLGLAACEELKPEADYAPAYGVEMVDNDGDGFEYGYDCDDEDAMTYPGAAPLDSEEDCMTDVDGDDFGDINPDNENIVPGTDCDDADPTVNPEADNCD